MDSNKTEKCAHPACDCQVVGDSTSKYCSGQCELSGKTPDIECHCGHSHCTGRTAIPINV